MLIAVRNKTHVQKFKAQLKKEFDMKDLGETKKILGMEITRDKRFRQTLAILGELRSQGIGEIQHGRRKTSHHSFGRSLQIILQAVSTITQKGDVSSIICQCCGITHLCYGLH